MIAESCGQRTFGIKLKANHNNPPQMWADAPVVVKERSELN